MCPTSCVADASADGGMTVVDVKAPGKRADPGGGRSWNGPGRWRRCEAGRSRGGAGRTAAAENVCFLARYRRRALIDLTFITVAGSAWS